MHLHIILGSLLPMNLAISYCILLKRHQLLRIFLLYCILKTIQVAFSSVSCTYAGKPTETANK